MRICIRLSASQVRRVLNVPQPVFAKWEQQLEPVCTRPPRSGYSLGDLVAFAVLARAYENGHAMRQLRYYSKELFATFRSVKLSKLSGKLVRFDYERKSVELLVALRPEDRQTFTVDLDVIAARLIVYMDESEETESESVSSGSGSYDGKGNFNYPALEPSGVAGSPMLLPLEMSGDLIVMPVGAITQPAGAAHAHDLP